MERQRVLRDSGALGVSVQLVLAVAICGALILTPACDTVVNVPAPPHEEQLVPVGFFTPDSLWVVRLSHSVAFSDTFGPRYLDSATVEIWSRGERLDTLTHRKRGTYAAIGPDAKPDRPYTLRVEAPGFEPVQATDRLPPRTRVKGFRDTTLSISEASGVQKDRITITLEDPEGPTYYGLQVYQLRVDRGSGSGSPRLLTPSLFPIESADPALSENETTGLLTGPKRYVEAFFTDELFDGRTYELTLRIEHGGNRTASSTGIYRGFVVVLFAASEDFYRYWTTASKQLVNTADPFSEPIRVHSNVEGGLGVFAGLRYRFFPLGLDTLGVGPLTTRRICRYADSLSATSPLCDVIVPPRRSTRRSAH